MFWRESNFDPILLSKASSFAPNFCSKASLRTSIVVSMEFILVPRLLPKVSTFDPMASILCPITSFRSFSQILIRNKENGTLTLQQLNDAKQDSGCQIPGMRARCRDSHSATTGRCCSKACIVYSMPLKLSPRRPWHPRESMGTAAEVARSAVCAGFQAPAVPTVLGIDVKVHAGAATWRARVEVSWVCGGGGSVSWRGSVRALGPNPASTAVST